MYGNKEYYPGQTAPLLVVIQNGGTIQSLSGVNTQEAQLTVDNQGISAGEDYSASASDFQSSVFDNSASIDNQTSGGNVAAIANTLAGTATGANTSISASASQSSNDYYLAGTLGGVQINTQDTIFQDATTALGLSCQLTPGDATVDVVSGDQGLVGSLSQGQVGGGPTTLYTLSFGLYQPLQFWIRINLSAQPGHYQLPLVVTYKQLIGDYSYSYLTGAVLRNKVYVNRTVIIPLDIVIMPRFDLAITNVVSTEMVPDTNGYITMTVTNLGNLSVTNAVAFLLQPTLGTPQDQVSSNYPLNYELSSILAATTSQPQQVTQSMVVPIQNSQYLGDMMPGESRTVTFVVSVSADAEASNIPLSAVVSYDDPWEQEKSSNVKTFGVQVEPEMQFSLDPDPIEIRSGQSTVANITLVNNGGETANNAIVRMNALDPFTVSYDTTYLGNVAPGQSASSQFGISAKSGAPPTDYYVTLEVKYYDSHNNPHITKVIPLEIVVLPPPSIWDIIMANWWLILLLAVALLLILGYLGYTRMKKKRKPPPADGQPPENVEQPQENAGEPPENKETPLGGPGSTVDGSKRQDNDNVRRRPEAKKVRAQARHVSQVNPPTGPGPPQAPRRSRPAP